MHIDQPPPARRAGAVLAVLLAATLLQGCVNTRSERGVEPHWEIVGEEAFVSGQTTRAEVLELLGPPSQILSLKQETLFYYLHESIRAEGLILIVYNDRRETVAYQRAVFFFDERDVLREYAFGGPGD